MSITKKQFKYICGLAMSVNGPEKRQAGYTGSLPTVFISFSGHVATLTFQIHESGWKSGDRETLKEFSLKTDSNFDQAKYNEAVAYFKQLIAEEK